MSEQFDNAMMLARDAYRANNEEECRSFCNQALTVDPKSANAKALKGAAVLISFSLAGAASDAVEAIEIWRSISDASSLSDEYKDIVIEAAFEFRTRWYDAAKARYEEFKKLTVLKPSGKVCGRLTTLLFVLLPDRIIMTDMCHHLVFPTCYPCCKFLMERLLVPTRMIATILLCLLPHLVVQKTFNLFHCHISTSP